MGTPVGSQIYLQHGWRACAALSVGLSGAQIVVLLLRGPHCGRYTWVGWEGGWGARRRKGDAEKPGENLVREEVAPSDPEKAPETINIVGADKGTEPGPEGSGGEAPRREDVNSVVSASEQPEPQKRQPNS
jgi:hypothetical protein